MIAKKIPAMELSIVEYYQNLKFSVFGEKLLIFPIIQFSYSACTKKPMGCHASIETKDIFILQRKSSTEKLRMCSFPFTNKYIRNIAMVSVPDSIRLRRLLKGGEMIKFFIFYFLSICI